MPAGGQPFRLAVDPAGDVFTADLRRPLVHVRTAAGAWRSQTLAKPGFGLATAGDAVFVTEPQAGRIARVTPGGALQEASTGGGPLGIAAGPDGALWFADAGRGVVGRLDPLSLAVTATFPVNAGGQPTAVGAGPDGAVWFADRIGPRAGRVTTAGAVSELSLGSRSSLGDVVSTGGAVWIAEPTIGGGANVGTSIASIVPGAGPRQLHLAAPVHVNGDLAVAPDGSLWAGLRLGGTLARIDPHTRRVQLFGVPLSSGIVVSGLAFGPDGRLWIADAGGRVIAVRTAGLARPAVGMSAPATVRRGAAVLVRFYSTLAGSARLRVLRGGRVVAQSSGSAQPAGAVLRWSGRIAGRPAAPGRYTLALSVATGAGAARSSRTVRVLG